MSYVVRFQLFAFKHKPSVHLSWNRSKMKLDPATRLNRFRLWLAINYHFSCFLSYVIAILINQLSNESIMQIVMMHFCSIALINSFRSVIVVFRFDLWLFCFRANKFRGNFVTSEPEPGKIVTIGGILHKHRHSHSHRHSKSQQYMVFTIHITIFR